MVRHALRECAWQRLDRHVLRQHGPDCVLGQKMAMTDPDMGTWQYAYDLAGNLITQTDALSQLLWFKYDALNRLVENR